LGEALEDDHSGGKRKKAGNSYRGCWLGREVGKAALAPGTGQEKKGFGWKKRFLFASGQLCDTFK